MYKEARAISIKICLTNLLEVVSSRVVVVHWLCCVRLQQIKTIIVIVIAMIMIHLGHHRRESSEGLRLQLVLQNYIIYSSIVNTQRVSACGWNANPSFGVYVSL